MVSRPRVCITHAGGAGAAGAGAGASQGLTVEPEPDHDCCLFSRTSSAVEISLPYCLWT